MRQVYYDEKSINILFMINSIIFENISWAFRHIMKSAKVAILPIPANGSDSLFNELYLPKTTQSSDNTQELDFALVCLLYTFHDHCIG